MSPIDTASAQRLTRIANGLTLTRIAFAPVVAAMIVYRNPWWVSFAFLWILGITDRIDGDLARKVGPTKRGAFLDTLADKILLLAAGYALVYVSAIGWIPMTLIAVREIGMMGYRVYWSRFGLSMPARKSGKYKAVVQGLALVSAMAPPLEGHPGIVRAVVWIAVVFTLFSAGQYIVDGRKALSTTGSLKSQ